MRPVLIALIGLACAAFAPDGRVQPLPSDVRAAIGKTPPEGSRSFAFPGWEAMGGAMIGVTYWDNYPAVSIDEFRKVDRILIGSKVMVEPGARPVWRLQDAVVAKTSDREALAIVCHIADEFEETPGLIALVDPTSRADPKGRFKAIVAWQIDRDSQKLTRQTGQIACAYEQMGD